MTSTADSRDVRILEAACRVVLRDGAHALRMAAVAREAGVSKALVHYYFPTRQELLRRAFAHSEARWEEAVQRALARDGSAAERIARLVLLSVEPGPPYDDHRALGNEVWSSLRFDDELRPEVEAGYARWLARLVELVRAGHADGSVPQGIDARATALRLSALADGVESLRYVGLLRPREARSFIRDSVRRELEGA